MDVRRKDGRSLSAWDDVVLVVGTFGLWVPISLIMEAWDLYNRRNNKRKALH